jgi:hypothetical protein
MKILLAILFSLAMFDAAAQNILAEYDSIPVSKPKMKYKVYQFNNPLLQEISIDYGKPKTMDEEPNKFWKNLGGGAFTLFTGLSTETSEEKLWVTKNELKSDNNEYSWDIHFFFVGEYSKTRDRIKNEDGSVSVETNKGVYINWSNPTYGLILEKNDTIGNFTVITNLQSDGTSQKWLSKLENESSVVPTKKSKFVPEQWHDDFKIAGNYKGKSFQIIVSGRNIKSLILFDNKPVAIFKDEPALVVLGKKNRIEKYLLHEKMIGDAEIIDLFRLSVLSRLLANLVSIDFYEL